MSSDSHEKPVLRQVLSGLGVGIMVALVVFTTATAATGTLTGSQAEFSIVGDAAAQTSNGDTNTIRLQANGSITDYTFQAENLDALEKTDIEDKKDLIEGKRAIGSVGEGGIDEYQYTGTIHNFRTENASKISIWINGKPVDSSNIGKEGELSSGSDNGESTQESTDSAITGSYNLSNPDYGQQPTSVGNEITVTARITNTGDKKFSAEIGLGTQGEVVEDQEVSLFPGSSQKITFEHSYDSPGTYAMQIGPLNDSGVMTDVSLQSSNVTVLEEGEVTTTESDESIGIATTSEPSGIPTVAQNKSADGSSFIKEESKNLTVTDLSVASSSSPFRPGDLLSFNANISNPSSKRLNDTFAFAVNNDTVTQQTLTVSAGESESVVFTHRFAESGNYTVAVDDETTRIQIKDYQRTTPAPRNVSTTSENASSGNGSGAVGGIMNVLVGNIVSIFATVSIIIVGIIVSAVAFMHFSRNEEDIHR